MSHLTNLTDSRKYLWGWMNRKLPDLFSSPEFVAAVEDLNTTNDATLQSQVDDINPSTATLAADVVEESTTNTGVTVDGVKLKDGGVSANSMFAGFYPLGVQQTLSGPGAINITSYLTNVVTTGADALTLADGSQIGQKKKIALVTDGGDGTLTLTGYTSIVFNDATDYVLLIWNGTAWFVLENSGCTVNA